MKVLVLGNGAREHTLGWKFSQSSMVDQLFVAPGNAGTASLGINLPHVNPFEPAQVVKACQENKIDLVFVGPETYLEAGVIDALNEAGIPGIGPDKHRAQLESSKTFSKDFMLRNDLPTAKAWEFHDLASYEDHIRQTTGMIVVKKSGLAQGKGVLETSSHDEALSFGREILKNDSLLIEEFLTGFEVSVFVLSDGKDYVVLPPIADFKKALENDKGPNTGGMGAICPVPKVTPSLWNQILKDIVEPTMAALNKDGLNYKGILFIGLMITEQGPKILEFNARFGDPETQSLLSLIESDFGDLSWAMAQGNLKGFPWKVSNKKALGVVVAAPGYPGSYPKNLEVHGVPAFENESFHFFHAGTTLKGDQVVTTGGRCFTCVGIADTFEEAQAKAYAGAKKVIFDGAWYRKDIGSKFFSLIQELKMRRADRQIQDQEELKEIIAKSDVCHLGFAVNNEPYIVALNFGFFWGNKPVLYFHCASEGRKLDMMSQNSRVCFQMDLAHELVTADSACSWSMKYKSIVGYGNLEFIEPIEEKKKALDLIMNHYGYSGSPGYPDAMLSRIKVLKLEILQIDGKKKD